MSAFATASQHRTGSPNQKFRQEENTPTDSPKNPPTSVFLYTSNEQSENVIKCEDIPCSW